MATRVTCLVTHHGAGGTFNVHEINPLWPLGDVVLNFNMYFSNTLTDYILEQFL